MTIQTMQYQIAHPISCGWDTFRQVLRDVQHDTWKAKNRAMQMWYEWDNKSYAHKQIHGKHLSDKEIYGCTFGTHVYRSLCVEFPTMMSKNMNYIGQRIMKKWNKDRKSVFNGEISISSFSKGCPIELYKIRNLRFHDNGDVIADVPLLSKNGANQLSQKHNADIGTTITVKLYVGNGSSKSTMKRIVEGKYTVKSGQIIAHKNKWMIAIAYEFTPEQKSLDPNRIMGIDMGIVNAAYMAVNDSKWRDYIEGSEIEHFRRGVENRRKQLLRQGKYCGDGRIGHGRHTRIKPIEKLSERVSNFRESTNHKYSRYIVDTAVKLGCGTIQMEDLTGIRNRDKKSKFLQHWSYYDLQQDIRYKAEQFGIKVVLVNPKYTSQRCSKCGYIDEASRPDQATFKCISCGYTCNADYNAACNIATKDIDKIIAEYKNAPS